LLKDALTKNPKDTDALLTRGRRRLAAADYAQAEADANAVLQFLPNSAPARALLAGVHQARGETYLERQALGEVVRLDPENLTMRVRLAGLLRGSRSFRAALELMDQAPASQKRTLGWILERNWILVESEDETQLALGITEALAIGRPPDVVLQLGMLKYQQRNYAAARAAAEELLSHAPGDTLALDLLARTYVAEKQAPEALRRIHGAVAAQPTSARLQQLLGRFLLFMNRPADARNAFLAAHKLDPRSPTPVIALAEVDLQNGHLDQVRSELAPLIASPHANADARMILAEAELNSGNSESALSLYRGVADEQPDNVKALNNTAYLLVDRMHRPDEALKYAQRAVELAPGSPDFEHTLGWTLYAKRMYNMALPHLAMAAAKDPTVEHLYHLAAARFKIGDARMGFQAMEAAMKIDPRGPGADAAWAARAESR
jgi:tetratricopeptide (TPR) repeat protein